MSRTDRDLRNKLVLVTGANGGIGRALCHRLDAAGAKLVLNGMREAELLALKDELGPGHVAIAADVSTAAGREALAAACQAGGGLDVLVNLAGILNCDLFSRQPEEVLERMIMVNAAGPLLLTRRVLSQMLARPSARIINVGSIFGSIGHPGFAAYCASKATLKMLSEALARELSDTTVSVGYIAPRATDTPLNSSQVVELNRALGNHSDTPEAVAAEILAMVRGDRRQRFLGWPEKFFVRLNALLPGIVHKALAAKLPVIKYILG